MKRITILLAVLLFAPVLRAAKQPNILFIFSDDHAYQAISAYSGGRLNKTPNIDRIANAGVRFDRCYVPNSICGHAARRFSQASTRTRTVSS